MEGERSMGAGPETTGIEDEQLRLFTEQHEERDATEIDEARPAQHHPHRLGSRPYRLHTSEHYGVRGDRLEGRCLRRSRNNN